MSSDFSPSTGTAGRIFWLGEKPLDPARRDALRHTSREIGYLVREVRYNSTSPHCTAIRTGRLSPMNGLAHVSLHTATLLFYDNYKKNRQAGRILPVDELTNALYWPA